ncbi:MAG: zinc-binding alcohol dehydrogenase family protein [Acidimicrobiia bacterium]|nr:zinc-binding alcohol dehydrogenase family protein [Acidimicrobiia bacterium]
MSRALVLDTPGPAGSGPLHLENRPALAPDAGQLLVRVIACGVCRTDLQLVEGDLVMHRRPVVPGHQVVGEVIVAGERATHRIGERVGATWLGGACGRCEYCTDGLENLCLDATFHGWDHDGGYADEMVIDDAFAVGIDTDREPARIAPLLCAGVIGYRALDLTGLGTGQRLGLYGFGSSAALVLQLALDRDIEVHVATRSAPEQARARHMGAASIGGYDQPPPQPLHAAITFAPVGSVVVDALRAVRRGGTVVVNAIHLDEMPAFDYDLLWHERSIRSVANVTRADIAGLLAADARIGLAVDPQPYGLIEANQALADLAAGANTGPAVLLT